MLRGGVNPVYITSIDEIASSPFHPQPTSIHRELANHWNHRESKPDLTEHSTRIGPGVRARVVVWWWFRHAVVEIESAPELRACHANRSPTARWQVRGSGATGWRLRVGAYLPSSLTRGPDSEMDPGLFVFLTSRCGSRSAPNREWRSLVPAATAVIALP